MSTFSGPTDPANPPMTSVPCQVTITRTDPDAAVVSVAGEIDCASAPQLRTALLDLLSGGCQHVTVDLEQVDYLDSAGLTVLLSTHRELSTRGGTLVVVGYSPMARRVFEITGLVNVLTLG